MVPIDDPSYAFEPLLLKLDIVKVCHEKGDSFTFEQLLVLSTDCEKSERPIES